MTTANTKFRFDPYSAEVDADPFPAYRTLRDDYPCFWSDEAGMWVLTRYDDILAALGNWRLFSSARGNLIDELPGRAGATLGTTDPPRHDRLRGLIQKAVTRSALDHLVAPTQERCRGYLDALRGRGRFDLVGDYAARVTVDLLFSLFAMPDDMRDVVRQRAMLMVQTDPLTRQKGPEHLEAYHWMADFAQRLVTERKGKPGDDLLSNFITSEIDGEKLLDREVQLTVTTLIMAGIESLSGFMTMFGLNLADHPDARQTLVAQPDRIPDAIEESLRFNTSAQRFKRCATADIELHGQKIAAGEFVMLCYGSANRDPRKFDQPDRYDIARRPKAHLGFGGGVHACLGAMIARLATRVAFEELLSAVPVFHRAEEKLDWVPSSNFRSPLSLPIDVG